MCVCRYVWKLSMHRKFPCLWKFEQLSNYSGGLPQFLHTLVMKHCQVQQQLSEYAAALSQRVVSQEDGFADCTLSGSGTSFCIY